jgi:hypothetical protein
MGIGFLTGRPFYESRSIGSSHKWTWPGPTQELSAQRGLRLSTVAMSIGCYSIIMTLLCIDYEKTNQSLLPLTIDGFDCVHPADPIRLMNPDAENLTAASATYYFSGLHFTSGSLDGNCNVRRSQVTADEPQPITGSETVAGARVNACDVETRLGG